MPKIVNYRKLTLEKRDKFLEILANTANVSRAAREIEMSRVALYDERNTDPKFKALWDKAVEMGTRHLEDEAIRRATEGTARPVFQGGECVGHVREFSDTLLIFLLKARDPKFKESSTLAVTGPNGGPMTALNLNMTDPAEAARVYQQMLGGSSES